MGRSVGKSSVGSNFSWVYLFRALNILFGSDFCSCALKSESSHSSVTVPAPAPFVWHKSSAEGSRNRVSWARGTVPREPPLPPRGVGGQTDRVLLTLMWSGCGWSSLHLLNQIIWFMANQIIGDQRSACAGRTEDTLWADPFRGVPAPSCEIDLLKQRKKYGLFERRAGASGSKFGAPVQQAAKR